ncbi:MAG: hypothetical protein KY475_21755 [Planctomycetes bacterium]|nr:hypothetical protein [Planctomycetota bacterium]
MNAERDYRTPLAFGCLVLVIAAVSVHDAALVVLHYSVIRESEWNPIGRWLIDLQHGDVWLFVQLKMCGTAVVGAVLVTMYGRRRRLAFTVAAAVACFQVGLLLFLSLW